MPVSQVGAGIWVGGIDCDVSSPASVQRLADGAASQMGSIDVWINNAGFSGSFQVLAPSSIFLEHTLSAKLTSELLVGMCACMEEVAHAGGGCTCRQQACGHAESNCLAAAGACW